MANEIRGIPDCKGMSLLALKSGLGRIETMNRFSTAVCQLTTSENFSYRHRVKQKYTARIFRVIPANHADLLSTLR